VAFADGDATIATQGIRKLPTYRIPEIINVYNFAVSHHRTRTTSHYSNYRKFAGTNHTQCD